MDLTHVPWAPIIFFLSQTALFIGFLFKLHYDNIKNKEAIQSLQNENKELKKELKDIMAILIKVEFATQQLMMGRMKTGSKTEL